MNTFQRYSIEKETVTCPHCDKEHEVVGSMDFDPLGDYYAAEDVDTSMVDGDTWFSVLDKLGIFNVADLCERTGLSYTEASRVWEQLAQSA